MKHNILIKQTRHDSKFIFHRIKDNIKQRKKKSNI